MGILTELEELSIKITANGTQFLSELSKVEGKMVEGSAKIMELGLGITEKVSLPLTIMGGLAVHAFDQFDEALTRSALAFKDMTADMRNQTEQLAMTLSGRTEYSAAALAKTMGNLGRAQMSVTEAMQALPLAEDFATASGQDLSAATAELIKVQGALGLRSKDTTEDLKNMAHVEDVLTEASFHVQGGAGELAGALTGRLGPVLRNLHVSIEEAAAMMTVFAESGIESGQAGARLTQVYMMLQKSLTTNAEAWRALGLTVYDSTGKMLPMANIVAQLETRFIGASDAQKAAALSMLGFQSRSQTAVLTLIGQSQHLKELKEDYVNSGDAAKNAAEAIENTFGKQLEHLENAITNVGIAIGQKLVPHLKVMVERLQEATMWWGKMTDMQQSNIITIGLWAAAIGPILLVIAGMAKGLIALYGIIATVAGWFGTLSAAIVVFMDTAMAPVLLVGGIFGGIIVLGLGLILAKIYGTHGIIEAFYEAGKSIMEFGTKATQFLHGDQTNTPIGYMNRLGLQQHNWLANNLGIGSVVAIPGESVHTSMRMGTSLGGGGVGLGMVGPLQNAAMMGQITRASQRGAGTLSMPGAPGMYSMADFSQQMLGLYQQRELQKKLDEAAAKGAVKQSGADLAIEARKKKDEEDRKQLMEEKLQDEQERAERNARMGRPTYGALEAGSAEEYKARILGSGPEGAIGLAKRQVEETQKTNQAMTILIEETKKNRASTIVDPGRAGRIAEVGAVA